MRRDWSLLRRAAGHLQRALPASSGPRRYAAHDGRDQDNYMAQVEDNYRPLANGFAYYRELVEPLARDRSIGVMPLYELATTTRTDVRCIGLRHDVDADPIAGLRLARHLARIGACGSFYLLHTAPYYGDVYDGVFVRNPALPEWIRGYIVAGCELGLHNDVIGLALAEGYDPNEVLAQELLWLRSQGAVIRGTVAHNSIVVSGAENYEVFAERLLWPRVLARPSGTALTLGTATLAEHKLSYEGTFARPRHHLDRTAAERFAADAAGADLRSEAWMRRYLVHNPCCDWTVEVQIWLTGRDTWVVAGTAGTEQPFLWNVTLAEVRRFIAQLPLGSRTMFVLHPEYFGDYGAI